LVEAEVEEEVGEVVVVAAVGRRVAVESMFQLEVS
jgi:hypothetical protein